jgi:inosose dehydratase
MKVRLGVNPIMWSNDDMPALGAMIPLEQCLREAAEAGFEGIELGHKFPRDALRLRPLLAEYKLALVSGWYSTHLLNRSVGEEYDAMMSHLELLSTLGCRVVIVAETTGAVHSNYDAQLRSRLELVSEDAFKRLGERLSGLGEYTRSMGLQLAYHHHMGTVVQTQKEIDSLMAHSADSVGLLLDTGHLTLAGGNIAETLTHHGARIVHVHCKDVRQSVMGSHFDLGQSFLHAVVEGVFTVPSDGCVDFSAVAKRLKDWNYEGWWVVEAEQDPEIAVPSEYAKRGFACLDKLRW